MPRGSGIQAHPARWYSVGKSMASFMHKLTVAEKTGEYPVDEPDEGDYYDDDIERLKPFIYYGDNEGLIIECEAHLPPSMEGRKVYVHIRGTEVEWLMKALRQLAADRRNKPMENND